MVGLGYSEIACTCKQTDLEIIIRIIRHPDVGTPSRKPYWGNSCVEPSDGGLVDLATTSTQKGCY